MTEKFKLGSVKTLSRRNMFSLLAIAPIVAGCGVVAQPPTATPTPPPVPVPVPSGILGKVIYYAQLIYNGLSQLTPILSGLPQAVADKIRGWLAQAKQVID